MAQEAVRITGRYWHGAPGADLRNITVGAFRAALAAADPFGLIRRSVKLDADVLSIRRLRIRLGRYERIFILGGGKAAGGMAVAIEGILGDRITDGVVNVPVYLPLPNLRRIRPHPATHPYPAETGTEGVRQMLDLAEGSTEKDLFLCLLSGGGSALMPAPAEGLKLEDKVATTTLLLNSGADIREMNVVRKHLSAFKGGRLAERLQGSRVVSLVISDVPGDRFDTVSSGPTAPDPTTFSQARRVLERYHIWESIPDRVSALLTMGERGQVADTPKPGSPIFRRVSDILIGSNRDARLAAYVFLKSKRIAAHLHEGFYQGEAVDVGESLARELLPKKGGRSSALTALVAGGEATVTVRGTGKGGRNQELVLSAAGLLRGRGNLLFAALATDGIDGPTEAAGAIADGDTVERGLRLGFDPETAIRNNDSNGYFRKLGGLLLTGPTGTNVNDIVVALAQPERLNRQQARNSQMVEAKVQKTGVLVLGGGGAGARGRQRSRRCRGRRPPGHEAPPWEEQMHPEAGLHVSSRSMVRGMGQSRLGYCRPPQIWRRARGPEAPEDT